MVHCGYCGQELAPDMKFCTNCGKAVELATPPRQAGPRVSAADGTGKYCQFCGMLIAKEAEICYNCGRRVMEAPRPVEQKNPGLAAVLSFLFAGLGQMYNGQIGKGISYVVLGILFAFSIIILIGIILYPAFWIYNIYDAYTSAKNINAGLDRPD